MFSKLTLVVLAIFIFSCSNENETKKEECNETPCTQNFVTISISIKDAAGVPVPLDSFKVVAIDTSKDLTLVSHDQEFENHKKDGFYPLFSDAYRIQYQNATTTISFKGYISDNEVINEVYEVGADCCHVSLTSGNIDLVLD
ncbi:hypothetical protein [Maribacter sp. ACAM166]|uniref:hypothetical protein n=1 Tax=Maribacter sp. ACAM166 TaxID=2508996 RepID=UPI0010FE8D47|nr:hypothetical protein [Maribacter sp. ACAM166]TLP71821.1 hypothetical protein ES765_19325 [Maribacter sp. ACAM166]